MSGLLPDRRTLRGSAGGIDRLRLMRIFRRHYVARIHQYFIPDLPTGGTAMFALLALAGDLGGAAGPAIVGNVSQKAANNLQAGVLAGIGFPIVLVLSVFYIRRRYK